MAETDAEAEALLASIDEPVELNEINTLTEIVDAANNEVLPVVTPPTRTYFPRKRTVHRPGQQYIPTSTTVTQLRKPQPQHVQITPLPIRQSTMNTESGTMTVEIPQSLVRKYDPSLGGKIVYYKDVRAVDEYVQPLKDSHEIDVLNINKGTPSESYIVMIKPKSAELSVGDATAVKCPVCKRENVTYYTPATPTVEDMLSTWLLECSLAGKPSDLCTDCGEYIVPTLIENQQQEAAAAQKSGVVDTNVLTRQIMQSQASQSSFSIRPNTKPNKCLGCCRNVYIDPELRDSLRVLPVNVEGFNGDMEKYVVRRMWLSIGRGHIMAPSTEGIICENCDKKATDFFDNMKSTRGRSTPGVKRARMDNTDEDFDEEDNDALIQRVIHLVSKSTEELKQGDSIFAKTDEESLSKLSADYFHDELEKQAPVFHALIKGLVSTNSNCKRDAEVAVASTLLYSQSFKLNAWQIRNTLIYEKNQTPASVMKMLHREKQVVPKAVLDKLSSQYTEVFLNQLNSKDSEPRYFPPEALQAVELGEKENEEDGKDDTEGLKQGPPPLEQVQCPHCTFIPAARSVFGLQRHVEQNHVADPSKQCVTCGHVLDNKKKVAAHMLYHDLMTHKCDTCKIGFENEKQWKDHQQHRCPETPNSLMCAICEFPERSVKGLHEHQRAHGPSEIYKVPCYCTFCHAPFRNITTLGKHFEDSHPGQAIKCPHCEESCENWYLLRDHLYMIHRKRYRVNPFPFNGKGEKCSYCTQRFADEGQYAEHKTEHEAQGWYLCETCDAVFWQGKPGGHKCLSDPTRASFKHNPKKLPSEELRYTKLSDGTNAVKYSCNNCRFEAVTKALMEKHSVTHYGYNAREIYCMACYAPFPTKPALYKHLVRVHKFSKTEIAAMRAKGKSQPHMMNCKHCDAFFKSPAALTAHMHSVHPRPSDEDDSLKIYACNHCDRRCRSFKGLHEHQRMKHGIEALSPHPDPKINRQLYKCKHCDKMCISKKGVLEHMRLKHDTFEEPMEEQDPSLFPYECTECEKRCKTTRGLKHHLRSHAREALRKPWVPPIEDLDPDMYPHKCSQCDKRCKTPKGLNEHIKLTHQRAERIRTMLQSNVQVHYKCSACNKLFISKTACIRHKEICSKMASNIPLAPPPEAPKYQCANCNETFFDWSAVQRHVQLCGQTTLNTQEDSMASESVIPSHEGGETIVGEDVSALEILQQVMEGHKS